MKKLISKIGIITFSLSPLVAVASTPISSPTSVSPQFNLIQSFKTKLSKSFQNSKWVEQTQSNSGSNIFDGNSGTIFEDSRGNLWSMGKGTPLQKYDYKTKRWTTESSVGEKSGGSNITNGESGTIFEDSRGSLWSMGDGTPLQKYNYQTKKWTTETSNGEGSSGNNITDGWGATIFEDSRGNLWSMGWLAPLQKYDYQTKKWTTETNDRKNSSGSNIIRGYFGTIFEDSRGNLWSMGSGTRLQKYNYQTKKWITETSNGEESSGSNIINGYAGTIFEDSRGNLWSMAESTPLQKYDYQTKKWTTETNDSEIGSGSNIINGEEGTIFEDSRGNLWSMGSGTHLQKYDYQTKKWTTETNDRENSSGSNIIDGQGGTIFEDSRGNLWSMGNGTPLQKYNYQTKKWTTETNDRENSSGSNMINGQYGTIFEDSRGNLWSMGNGTKLQKLTPKKEANIDDQKINYYNLNFKTRIISSSKILLSIQGLREYQSNLFSHLKYKKKTENEWKVVKNKILELDRTNYNFRWVLGAKETLACGQELPQEIIIKSDGSIETIITFQQTNIAKVIAFLNTLSNQTISALTNNSKLVSAITKPKVLTLIKVAKGYNDLTNDQQALIIKDLISLFEDPIGTLKVIVTFKNEIYELKKDGFKLPLETEANKFQDFASTDTIKSAAATLKVSSKNVLNIFKKIGGYQRPANLANDIAITKVIFKKALNPQTRKVTFELTIARQEKAVKKDVAVTFRALKTIPKPNKKDIGELSTRAIVGIYFGSIFGIGIISFLIFYLAKRNKKIRNKK